MTRPNITTQQTRPFRDQKPGTAGLRKKVVVFQQPHYLENFLAAIFESVNGYEGQTLVIGGDGRFHNRAAIQTAIRMAVAYGFGEIIVGQGGILSTPAASHVIRHHGAFGGLVLSASHNPAGPDGDFGIKFNIANGGQASETLTDAIHARSNTIREYRICELPKVDIDTAGETMIAGIRLRVIDPVEDYAQLMQSLFDFDSMREWLKNHRVAYDAMHAVTGPYAKRLLVELLGADEDSIHNATPLEDFGGGHPDPNLKYAKDLVKQMFADQGPDFGGASDGDGDRNMILGHNIFVSPGDSLAVLAANLHHCPGYAKGISGIARSMPTSRAADKVAHSLDIPIYETPTGWRFFCNLLDNGLISICGEESFGTGSDHVREKDGLWAILAWINILAVRNESVRQIMLDHWQTHGRHYYQRHDYEGLDSQQAQLVMDSLEQSCPQLAGNTYGALRVTQADMFAYDDPVDGSRSENQGLRVIFGDDARLVMRLSGTGTSGATLRLYLEKFETETDRLELKPENVLDELASLADEVAGISRITGRDKPDVVT